MKHALRLTLGLLALGFATSVLVAWGCYAMGLDVGTNSLFAQDPLFVENDTQFRLWLFAQAPGSACGVLVASGNPDTDLRGLSGAARESASTPWPIAGLLMSVSIKETPGRTTLPFPGREHADQILECYGWPCFALSRRMEVWFAPTKVTPFASKRAPMDAHSQFVPGLPIYRGLLLNTLFYAALWTVPLVLIPALLRWRRSKQGGCSTCGYEISGLNTCPECGTSATESASP